MSKEFEKWYNSKGWMTLSLLNSDNPAEHGWNAAIDAAIRKLQIASEHAETETIGAVIRNNIRLMEALKTRE